LIDQFNTRFKDFDFL